jgi:hypothetical protein
MFEVHDDADAPEPYRRAAAYAFAGYPAFRQQIAQFPEQWTPFGISNKHVVIKEVNPLALEWYLQHGPMALIFLIRHPVAITKSFLRLGWWSGDQPEDWAEFGRRILEQWAPTYERMQYHSPSLLVRYEDVCLTPLEETTRMYEFCGFDMTSRIREQVGATTEDGDRSKTYGTKRDSQAMAYAWRDTVDPDLVAAMREVFAEHPISWYGDDEW